MPHDTIYTKYHKMTEGRPSPFPVAPHYYIHPEIVESINAGEFDAAYKQVINAGYGAMLPWPEIIIEFQMELIHDGDKAEFGDVVKYHVISYMQMVEGGEYGAIRVRSLIEMAFDGTRSKKVAGAVLIECNETGMLIEPKLDKPAEDGSQRMRLEFTGTLARRRLTNIGGRNIWEIGTSEKTTRDAENALADREADAAKRAHYLACVVLNTSGIEKVVIEPGEKLNKARQKSGKPRIPTHTVMRIGHVYDRAGNAVKRVAGQKIHLREGHIRHQAHGPKNSLRKLIWIAPILVNYKPETILPKRVKL